jgi:Flp pilus assembly protein TadG
VPKRDWDRILSVNKTRVRCSEGGSDATIKTSIGALCRISGGAACTVNHAEVNTVLKIRQYIRNHRGQALAELALTLPVLMAVLAGIFMGAMVLSDYITMAEAARQGARYAIIHPTDNTNIVSTAKAAAPNYDPNSLSVVPTPTTTSQRTSGTPVTVTVTYVRHFSSSPDHQNDTLFGLPMSWPVTGVAVMQVE